MRSSLQNGCSAVCFGVLVSGALLAVPAAEPAANKEAIVAAPVALGRPVDFEKDVNPILESNCLACHNVGIAESKLNIETVESILKGGKRGPAVVPKSPEKSLLFQVASRNRQPAMPPLPNKVEANALTPQQLGVLKQWILEGAKGSAGGSGDSIQWQPIPPTMKSIFAVAVSPNGGRFVAAGRVNQIVVYDVPAGRETDRLVDPLLSNIQVDGHAMYPGGAADRDFVHALAFSPDGTLLAAAGYRVVKLWKRPKFVEKQNVDLGAAPTALAVSPDGTLVATALPDHSVVVRHAAGTEVRQLNGPTAAITALQFSPDGKTLYAASLDRAWRAWNVSDGKLRGMVPTSSPLTALALNKGGTQLISGCADGTIRIYAAAPNKPKPLREWKAHTKPITSLALVMPAGEKLASGSEDHTVRIWQIASAKQLAKFNHDGPVTAVAVSPDGQVLASAGMNRITRLWKTTGGKQIAEISGSLSADRMIARRKDAEAIVGQHLATAAARITAANQELKERQEALKKAVEAQTASAKALADFTAKEKTAAESVAAAKRASQTQPKDAALKKKLEDAQKALTSLDEAKKNGANAAASAVRNHEAAKKSLAAAEAKLREEETLKKQLEAARKTAGQAIVSATVEGVNRLLPVRSLAFSPDGSTLAIAGDDPEIQLFDAHTARPLDALSGHSAAVIRVAFGKGSTLISAGSDKKLVAWETNPRWIFLGRIGPKSDAPLELGASSLVGRVLCLAFSHDGKLLATGGGEPSRNGDLKTWKIPALTLDREFKDAHSDTVFGVDFSRDGKYLASGAADKFVKVFETQTGKQARSFEGHTHQVLGVSWKADGSLLASAGADNAIKVWNFETGEQQRNIATHSKQVTSIQFLGTGPDILSASGDKTARLHHAIDGDNYRTLDGSTDYLYSAAATPDESLIAAGGEDGVLRLWNGATGKSVATFPPPKSGKDSTQANAAKR
jgi:WD40 repeat protein